MIYIYCVKNLWNGCGGLMSKCYLDMFLMVNWMVFLSMEIVLRIF